ncbi:MAG: ABC-2 family transporter protein [Deinococcales bacterium]
MRRYLKLLKIFWGNSLQLELEYRANFWGKLLSVVMGILTNLAMIWILFSQTKTIGGWTADEVLVLMGVFHLVHAVIVLWLGPT